MWSSSSQKTRGFIVSQTSAVPSLYWKISFHMEHPYNTSAHFGIFVRNFCVNLVSIHSGQGVMAANLLVFTKRVMWPGSSQKTRGFIVSRTSDVPSSYWKISSHWDHPYNTSAHFGTRYRDLFGPTHYAVLHICKNGHFPTPIAQSFCWRNIGRSHTKGLTDMNDDAKQTFWFVRSVFRLRFHQK